MGGLTGSSEEIKKVKMVVLRVEEGHSYYKPSIPPKVILGTRERGHWAEAFAHEHAHRVLGHCPQEDIFQAFTQEIDAWKMALLKIINPDRDFIKKYLYSYVQAVYIDYGDDEGAAAERAVACLLFEK